MNFTGKCVLLLTSNRGDKIAKIIDKLGQTIKTYEFAKNNVKIESKESHLNEEIEKERKKGKEKEEEKEKEIGKDLIGKDSKNKNYKVTNNKKKNINNYDDNNDINDGNINNKINNDIGGQKMETHTWNFDDLKMEFSPHTWEVLIQTI